MKINIFRNRKLLSLLLLPVLLIAAFLFATTMQPATAVHAQSDVSD